MNKAKALEWFKKIEEKDPGAWSAVSKRSAGGLAFSDDSAWNARARAFVLAAEQAVKRTFPANDPVVRRWDQIFKEEKGASAITNTSNVYAAVALVREAHEILASDRFETLIAGVRAETVGELVDQADAMVTSGWLAAAMVTAGGAVESTLRHICDHASPPITIDGHGSIEKYNTAIAKRRNEGTELLNPNQTKLITAWGGLRNDAAHDPIEFQSAHTRASVKNTIDGIRLFLALVVR
jgi:hypothetical protein